MAGWSQPALATIVAAVAYAVWKYHQTRRRVLHDRQSLFYSPSKAHSVTLVKLPADTTSTSGAPPHLADPEATKALCASYVRALVAEGAKLVYAGLAVVTPLHSAQLPERQWDAVLLLQHDSADARAAAFGAAAVREAAAPFAAVYTVGMRRHPVIPGFIMPVLFSVAKLVGAVIGNSGADSKGHFTHAGKLMPPEQSSGVVQVEKAFGRVGERARDAIVVMNLLIDHKDAEIARRNARYGMRMMRMLGEQGAGAMHFGTAEAVPGQPVLKEPWENVAMVYYPGKQFFLDLMRSTFWNSTGPGKKQGDTEVVITAPWPDLLV